MSITTTPSWVTSAMRKRLGVESDRSIAREVGVSHEWVRLVRDSLGIPRKRTRAEQLASNPEFTSRLGRESDTDISKALGIDAAAVGDARRRIGVPRFMRDWKCGEQRKYEMGCRCEQCRRANADYALNFTPAAKPGRGRHQCPLCSRYVRINSDGVSLRPHGPGNRCVGVSAP